jgi:hypothetical protein
MVILLYVNGIFLVLMRETNVLAVVYFVLCLELISVYLYFENLVLAHHRYVMQTAHLVPSTRTREFLKL